MVSLVITPVLASATVAASVNDADLRTLLLQLAETARVDLVLSDSVQGRVSFRAQASRPRAALSALVRARGLIEQVQRSSSSRPLIWVGTGEDAVSLAKQALSAEQAQEWREPIETRLLPLQHARVSELAKWLGAANGERLLGPRGRLDVDVRTNTLLVTDTSARVARLQSWLLVLDRPARQVMVETRLVAVSRTQAEALGARWQVTGPAWTGRVPLTAPGAEVSALRYGLLALSGHALDVELSALETSGQGDILARPSVVTAEQYKGVIASGQQIPYQESTHSGATTTRFVNAELSLEVTPFVSADQQIVLDLSLNHDSPGEIQASGARAIETNHLVTQVRLRDGQTLMLGGIFRTQSVRTVSRVPVLGNIPLLGYLFRRDLVREDKQELLIFVTPHVLVDVAPPPVPAVEMSDAADKRSQHLSGRAHGRGQDHHWPATRRAAALGVPRF
ncbi:MAG: secretin N-terminal domain-containing protein [Pseudomonadota bacterium]